MVVRKVDDEYCVFPKDVDSFTKGNSLGCHPTRAEALEQLAAIEASKNDSTDDAVQMARERYRRAYSRRYRFVSASDGDDG